MSNSPYMTTHRAALATHNHPPADSSPPPRRAADDAFDPDPTSPWSSTATLTQAGATAANHADRNAPSSSRAAGDHADRRRSAAPPTALHRRSSTLIRSVYPRRLSLYPLMLVVSIVSAVFLLIFSVAAFRSAGVDPGTVRVLDIVAGALFLVAALVEFLGIYAATTRRIALAKPYARLAVPAYLLAIAGTVLNLVPLVVYRKALVDQCTTRYTGVAQPSSATSSSWWLWDYGAPGAGDGNSASAPLTADQARAYCERLASSDLRAAIFMLVCAVLVGGFFLVVSLAFYAELRHPRDANAYLPTTTPVGATPGFSAAAAPYDDPSNPYATAYYARGDGVDVGGGGAYPPYYAAGGGVPTTHSYPPPPGPPPPPLYDGYGHDDDDDGRVADSKRGWVEQEGIDAAGGGGGGGRVATDEGAPRTTTQQQQQQQQQQRTSVSANASSSSASTTTLIAANATADADAAQAGRETTTSKPTTTGHSP